MRYSKPPPIFERLLWEAGVDLLYRDPRERMTIRK